MGSQALSLGHCLVRIPAKGTYPFSLGRRKQKSRFSYEISPFKDMNTKFIFLNGGKYIYNAKFSILSTHDSLALSTLTLLYKLSHPEFLSSQNF